MASDPFAIVRVKKPAANKNEWVGLLTALTAAEQASNDMTLRLRPGS
jgi:hypothetical protein